MHLWKFIAAQLEAQNLTAAIKPILAKLEDGKALVLLDGLDEVTTAAQRRFVRDVVSAFMRRYPDNRYLLTCRILSYQAPSEPNGEDLRIPALPAYTLAPLDEPKQDRFVAAWYAELAEKGQVRREEQVDKSHSLQTAVRRHDLQTMAGNPLLLTVMAVVHTHKGELPDARAILYGDTVDLLLSRWEAQKAGTGEAADGILSLLRQAGRSEIDLKSVLRKLAYDAQAQTGEGLLADIAELDLLHALADLKKDSEGMGDLYWAQKVTLAMKLRAGLLIELSPGVFAFPHRTFQEYLAGVHLTSAGDFASLAIKLADDRTRWREALLLAVGHLVYVNVETSRPLFLAGELCPSRLTDDETAWRKVWLAGEVLVEIGLLRVTDSDFGQQLMDRVRQRLCELIIGGKLTAAERVYAGDTLAQLGDPRQSVLSVDAMEFCWVPPGPFLLGSGKEDADAGKNEKPQREFTLNYGYWIARYPVSVAQFRQYVEDIGEQPADPDCLSGKPNHPVVYVSWDESKAFCAWLTQRLQQQGFIPQSWSVDLPNEPEWEKAARGGLQIPQQPLILQIPPNPLFAKGGTGQVTGGFVPGCHDAPNPLFAKGGAGPKAVDTVVIAEDLMDRRNPDCRDAANPCHPWGLDSGDPCRNDEQQPVSTASKVGCVGKIPIVESDRGGQVTYHGPGQLIAYTLFDLNRLGIGIRSLVSGLENAVINTLSQYGIKAEARRDAPGVYVDGKKIASLGLRIRKGCSYHGLSLNVNMDLTPFSAINPCGYPGLEITQLVDLGVPVKTYEVAVPLVGAIMREFGYDGFAVG